MERSVAESSHIFYKEALQKNFGKFTGKTPVIESPFNEVVCLQHTGVFPVRFAVEFCKIFQDSFLAERIWTTASGMTEY